MKSRLRIFIDRSTSGEGKGGEDWKDGTLGSMKPGMKTGAYRSVIVCQGSDWVGAGVPRGSGWGYFAGVDSLVRNICDEWELRWR